jgi:glycosyltransferase involved in cell wall biosynthesis
MAVVALLSGNHLCHNPRVIKEAKSLSGAGHEVLVLGAWVDPELKARDQRLLQDVSFRFLPVLDFTRNGAASAWRHFRGRARVKAAQIRFRLLGLESVCQLGYAVRALHEAALLARADLYIAHSEAGLAVASELLKRQCRVGVDMEDWFSEDLLPESRAMRPLRMLRSMEQSLLKSAPHASSPSGALSAALALEYECRLPAVIYNAFPWSDRQHIDGLSKDRGDRRSPSIHWYSQTVGPGRGLEDLLAALPYLKNEAEVHLRGTPVAGFAEWLAARVPEQWRRRVFVHGLVSNETLLSRIAEHDIGFAGEMKQSKSRDLTVTNKILHYLLAGLAVVASDTQGQREVASKAPGAVMLYPSGDAEALSQRLNALLESSEALSSAKAAALRAAEATFCWEQQEGVLLASVRGALGMVY